MLSILVIAGAAFGQGLSEPQAYLQWKGDRASFYVRAGEGEHVAEEAPAQLELNWRGRQIVHDTMGRELSEGVTLSDVMGAEVVGALSLSVCGDDGVRCRQVDFQLEGTVPTQKKGRVRLTLSAHLAEGAAHNSSVFRVDAEAVYQEARAAAIATDTLLLLDFSAVWCPPCNLLSAEVLHAQELPPVLSRYSVAVVDVDDPSSWTLKDRYAVGSYPTTVLTRADGTEVSRWVGYEERAAYLEWLERSSVGGESDRDRVALGPDSMSPVEAGEVAWSLVQRGQEDVAIWLARAASQPDHRDTRLASMVSAPTVDDAQWLALNAEGVALKWIHVALKLDQTPELQEMLRLAIRRDLINATGSEASDLLYYAAQLSDSNDGPLLYAAAVSTLRSHLTGDPIVDRAYTTWLAELMDHAGDLEGAIALLDEASARFTEEPTFLLAAAHLLIRAHRFEDALDYSERAYDRSWGDNRLRVTAARAESLVALGRSDEASTLVKRLLADLPAPGDELSVRSHRYRKKLSAFVIE